MDTSLSAVMRIFHSCWLLAGRVVNRKCFSSAAGLLGKLESISIQSLSKTVKCSNDEDIVKVGLTLGNALEPGDVLLLSGIVLGSIVHFIDVVSSAGDLGAGKTCLSRGIVRSKFNDMNMVVTSPSYLLDNCYLYDEDKRIHHVDLYRLPTGSDLSILNIPEIYNTSICLIEWPQRIQGAHQFPTSYVDVQLTVNKDETRDVSVSAVGDRWNDDEHKIRISEALNELDTL